MKAKYRVNPAWCVMGMTLLATQRAWAGPYPLDQLMVMLKEAESKLAVVQATITDLESQIRATNKIVAKLETTVRANKTASAGPEAELNAAREKLVDVRRRLAQAYGERRVLRNEIESIRVQIAAWEEINGGR